MKNLKYTDKPLLFTSVLLFLIGLVMIFSSSNIAAFMRYNSEPYYFLLRQSVLLIGGLIIFLAIIKFDTKFYSMMSWIAVLASIGLLAILFTYGTIANKAKSWIYISWFGFQPSEVAKVALIVWYAAFFELKRNKLDKISTCITPLLVSAIISVMVMLQPDFGTAGVILCGYFMGAGFKAIAKGKDGSTIWYDFIVAILGGFIIAGSTISYLDYKKNN